MPRCTVLMPVYNCEPYLAAAIQSILDQTFPDFHLLIVDDGSTDHSPEIASAFADARITVVRNETNQGIVAALNRGLAAIQTEYIARMDGDDLAVPDRLARQIETMDAHPEIGLCGGEVARFHPDGTSQGVQPWMRPLTHTAIQFQLLFHNPICHITVMLRRSVMAHHGLTYSAQYPYAEDYELWTRLGQRTRLANIPQLLARYRLHSDSSSARHRTEQRRSRWLIRLQQASYLGMPIPTEEQILYQALLDRQFVGDGRELTVARRHLDAIGRAGVRQLDQPRRLVLTWLNAYWFSACSRSSGSRLAAWALYCSRLYGWAGPPHRIGALLKRCIRGRNV